MTWQNPATPNSAAALYNLQAQTLAVATLQNISPVTPITITGTGEIGCDISQWEGYELQFRASASSVSGGMNITLKWYNNLTDTIPVDTVIFEQVPIGLTATPFLSSGHGPMRGLYLVVDIQNSPPPNVTYTLTIAGTTRNYLYDDWRSNGTLPSLTASAAIPWTNELCIVNAASVAAGSNISRGIFMYAGRTWVHFDTQAGVGTLTLTIFDWNNNEIWASHPGEGASGDTELILPRGPCGLSVANTGGAAATCNIAIIADRV